MQEFLVKFVGMAAGHPEAAVALGVAAVIAVFAWGVHSTSYRYR
jgi:hypothetical protein